jgi:hypothetical protein
VNAYLSGGSVQKILIITILDETVSLLSVGDIVIKINGEPKPKQKISD